MSSECSCYIAQTQDILQLYGILKQHVIIFSPPYSIYNILEPFLASHGRQVKIVINHRTRDVQIVESSIARIVLQTTIRAFQTHRLSMAGTVSRRSTQDGRSPQDGRSTQKDCPICFEKICENDGSALPCMHSFHMRCIRPWLMENNTCPVCRHAV